MTDAYDTHADGLIWNAALQNQVGAALGAVDTVGFRPHGPYDYLIWGEGGTYYRRNGQTGEVDDSNADAATLINNTLPIMPEYGGSLRVKGTGGLVHLYSPITFDGALVSQSRRHMTFTFDNLQLKDDVNGIVIKNWTRPLIINGQYISARDIAAHTSSLIKFEGIVDRATVNIEYLAGEQVNGLTTALEWVAGTGEYIVNNTVHFNSLYKFNKIFYAELTDTAWASINKIHLGWFEGICPRQVHIVSQCTQAFHHNIISGCGGETAAYNPQAYAPRWVIKLETDDVGSIQIASTTFQDFWIYSPSDEIYRADSGVYGTTFLRGMPRNDLPAWWHDGGSHTNFITCETSADTDSIPYNKFASLAQNIEHHVGADTLITMESGTVHTNLGAGGNIKLTLPQDATAGTMFEFVVMTPGVEFQIDAGAAGAIYINGAKSLDDAYIWADDEGESVKLMADGNGDWVALYTQGTWTVV